MKLIKIKLFFQLVMLLWLTACVESYDPPAIKNAESYLVVEGFLNAHGPTEITLTRTSKLNDIQLIPEPGADISVENKTEVVGQLYNEGAGTYTGEINLIINEEYRLRIETSGGEVYLSEFIPVKQSPPIQELFWEKDPSGLTIFLNTGDQEGTTEFYRWEYVETWEFNSHYESFLIYEDGGLKNRDPTNVVFTCWRSDSSENILTSSTVRLGADIIYRFPIKRFQFLDWKLSKKYSINVKQYPLTKEEYEFYELLKSNSEELGSFFDPQPSRIRGNIYNATDPEEMVIGYIGAGTVSEKRIYIENRDLDGWHQVQDCDMFEVTPDSVDYYFSSGQFIPLFYDMTVAGTIYLGTTRKCADCTVRGTTNKPSFWK